MADFTVMKGFLDEFSVKGGESPETLPPDPGSDVTDQATVDDVADHPEGDKGGVSTTTDDLTMEKDASTVEGGAKRDVKDSYTEDIQEEEISPEASKGFDVYNRTVAKGFAVEQEHLNKWNIGEMVDSIAKNASDIVAKELSDSMIVEKAGISGRAYGVVKDPLKKATEAAVREGKKRTKAAAKEAKRRATNPTRLERASDWARAKGRKVKKWGKEHPVVAAAGLTGAAAGAGGGAGYAAGRKKGFSGEMVEKAGISGRAYGVVKDPLKKATEAAVREGKKRTKAAAKEAKRRATNPTRVERATDWTKAQAGKARAWMGNRSTAQKVGAAVLAAGGVGGAGYAAGRKKKGFDSDDIED